jgi:hypothetical protein
MIFFTLWVRYLIINFSKIHLRSLHLGPHTLKMHFVVSSVSRRHGVADSRSMAAKELTALVRKLEVVMTQAGTRSSTPVARILFLLCRHRLAWNRPLPAADPWRAARRALGFARAEERLADAVDGEGGGKADPGREYCVGDQRPGGIARGGRRHGRAGRNSDARLAHRSAW